MMSATDRPLRTRLLAALAVSMPLHVALAALLVELVKAPPAAGAGGEGWFQTALSNTPDEPATRPAPAGSLARARCP